MVKMRTFLCKTQEGRMNSYLAPSGINYVSLLGQPVVVNADVYPEDAEYFATKRQFKELNAIEKMMQKPVLQDAFEDFKKELYKIKGLKNETAVLIAERYEDRQTLIDHIQGGGQLPTELTVKEEKLVLRWLNSIESLREYAHGQ